MESWFGFDDEVSSCGSVMRARSRFNSSATSTGMRHVSFLEESRHLNLQATATRVRESGRFVDTTPDLAFTTRRLELAERFKSLIRNTGERHIDTYLNTSDGTNFPHGEFDELKKNFRAVQEENFKLQAVITDVTEVNKRWQKYNNDRQMYVQRLLSTIQDQQEQMNKIAEDRIFHSKEQCDELGNAKPTLDTLVVENVRLQEEVGLLRRKLETADREHREHVEVLEFQLKAHRDDWEAERSEKQQALHDKEAADKKLRELQKDFRNLKLKYREEKLQNYSHGHCCGEQGQCNIFLPGSQVNVGHKGISKTYRTSGNLLPRGLPSGTTIFFGDDLTVDGEDLGEVKVTELPDEETESKVIEDVSSATSSNQLTEDLQEADIKHLATTRNIRDHQNVVDFDGNNNSSVSNSDVVLAKHRDSYELVGRKLSESSYRHLERKNSSVEASEDCAKMSCSVLHITPSGSGSSIELEAPPCEGDGLAAGGVTIGFSSGGLASVMAFSHTPIVKSSSLPVPEENKRKTSDEGKVNPLVSRWSFESNWSTLPIASPPISQNFAASVDSLTNERRSSVANVSAGASGVQSSVPNRKIPSWKMNYFDEGVATQTEEDVICPGCGQVFPPKLHLKFLDHFEKCQSNIKEPKRTSSSTVKSRN